MMLSMNSPVSETRQHILDVAKALMVRKGYTAVGLAEVVGAAGVPKGSFYYYFKSKDEFGQALLDAYFESYVASIDSVLSQPGSGRDRLLAYFERWITTQCSDAADGKCLVVKLGAEVSDLSDGMRQVMDRGTRIVIGRLGRCIEQGKADGSITAKAEDSVLAEALYQLWLGASLMAKLGDKDRAFGNAHSQTIALLT